jgi:hypothetical protein
MNMNIKLANGDTFNTRNSKRIQSVEIVPVKKRSNTVLVWKGPSVLDGKEILVFATLKSTNLKTGNMIQVSIVAADSSPLDSIKSGADVSVCGNCPHRRYTGGSCYVNVGHSPQSIYKAWKRGNIDTVYNFDLFKGAGIRFGSYGDPAAIPSDIVQGMAEKARMYTGYTHQFNHKNFDHKILRYCQVSADTPKQALAYHARNLKTFRVKKPEQPLLKDEIMCLAVTQNLECKDCGLCDGTKVNVAINVHGNLKKRFK